MARKPRVEFEDAKHFPKDPWEKERHKTGVKILDTARRDPE